MAAGVSEFVVSGLKRDTLAELEQNLSLKAGETVAELTARFGILNGQAEAIAGRNMISLFALEAEASSISADRLLELAHLDYSGGSLEAILAEAYSPEETALALRLPVMRSEFGEFLQKSGFSGVSLLGKNLVPYFDFAFAPKLLPKLAPAEYPELLSIFSSGLPRCLPARLTDGELFMDLVYPVFDQNSAPHALDGPAAPVAPVAPDGADGTRRVSALLVLRLSVAEDLRLLDRIRPSLYRLGVLQENKGVLQLLAPELVNEPLELPGWKLQNGQLPLDARSLPLPQKLGATGQNTTDADAAYVLALPVPGLPWLVFAATDAASLEAGQSR
jgi:hypothetical protein